MEPTSSEITSTSTNENLSPISKEHLNRKRQWLLVEHISEVGIGVTVGVSEMMKKYKDNIIIIGGREFIDKINVTLDSISDEALMKKKKVDYSKRPNIVIYEDAGNWPNDAIVHSQSPRGFGKTEMMIESIHDDIILPKEINNRASRRSKKFKTTNNEKGFLLRNSHNVSDWRYRASNKQAQFKGRRK